MECAGPARGGAVVGEVPSREADAVADGVHHVLRGDDPGALPGRADESADRVPVAVVEPLAGRFPATCGAVARSPVGLTDG